MSQLFMRRAFATLISFLAISAAAMAQNAGTTVQERLGYPPTARLLIIHADDFGGGHSINHAIIDALERVG